MFAFLGVMNPIVCTTEINAKQEYDSGMRVFEIGTKEEFNYRRRQIQEAVRRCQLENRYNIGGGKEENGRRNPLSVSTRKRRIT